MACYMGNQGKWMATRRACFEPWAGLMFILLIKRQGEIDILEGVNDQGPNRASLHTSPGIHPPFLNFHRIMADIKMNLRLDCQMPDERFQTGYTKFHEH